MDVDSLASRDFHKNPNSAIEFGFDKIPEPELPLLNSTNASNSQNESHISPPKGNWIFINLTGNISGDDSDTILDCYKRIITVVNVQERATEFKEEIRKRLYVDTKKTSAFVRSKNCAEDDRPSSQMLGSTAVVFLCLTGFLTILPDIITVTMWLAKKFVGSGNREPGGNLLESRPSNPE